MADAGTKYHSFWEMRYNEEVEITGLMTFSAVDYKGKGITIEAFSKSKWKSCQMNEAQPLGCWGKRADGEGIFEFTKGIICSTSSCRRRDESKVKVKISTLAGSNCICSAESGENEIRLGS